MKEQFSVVNKGLEIVSGNLSNLQTMLGQNLSEAKNSPLGRELLTAIADARRELAKDLADAKDRLRGLEHDVEQLRRDDDRTQGAITLARNLGGGGLLIALGTALVAVLKLLRVIP